MGVGQTGELEKFYRSMLLIRRFEEEAARAYARGKVGGFLHLYIGQEAIAVGAAAALRVGHDYVFQTYRDHGTALALGMDPKAGMAELYGRDTGCARGLGGSMHFFDVERGFLGGWAVVGGHIPVAVGTAFKSRYAEEDRVTLCFFGEGATNIGGFHEGLSLAGLWKLPVVFICENNEYSMGTPLERTTPVKDIAVKAEGYGMPGEVLQGHDVLEVRSRIAAAVERARSGGGPSLLEIKTYRFRGHSMSDPGKYRTAEELEERKQRDPLLVTRRALLSEGVDEASLERVAEEVEAVITEAIAFAEESEPAKEESMHRFVYAAGEGG